MRSSIDLKGEKLMDGYKIAIIGTRPAGLEAAITTKIRFLYQITNAGTVEKRRVVCYNLMQKIECN